MAEEQASFRISGSDRVHVLFVQLEIKDAEVLGYPFSLCRFRNHHSVPLCKLAQDHSRY